jgi:hypothetical protein
MKPGTPQLSTPNLDHLDVTASGVYVVDAKKYGGRPHLRVHGGLIRPGLKDCSLARATTASLSTGC